ncbi:uncharacterized protein K452DRAFT_250340 [Aplosporella prunicola CBS 121167]|uniref:UDENN domain-containing protein n=1 Tax=Aplosporella prunicola CBS 121167 TaxID=1176127 RepID=A0A6A6BED3_9PEZI|nr:uncharacterized protein K452DRAFT_250340 [Aplosporella prunicola CBS 121167]KAF2141634.1 hypothetical protein K452DRAFT_250340 [Aplosporella prunicola CBS 121167]
MAQVLAQHPPPPSTTSAPPPATRKSSFSSFPSSRSPSALSIHRRAPSRSPQPSALRSSDPSSSDPPLHPKPYAPSPSQARMDRQLRSQYPSNSTENHVEYILVASFDIDRGSVMEHQYPGPISGDEHMLADLMLPDQAHVRSQDWTIFFLHKDTTAEEEAKEERRERRRKKKAGELVETGDDGEGEGEEDDDDDDDETDEEGFEGPPLIYVLNLVNTKQDTTVKRGAIVKAMAICTRHSFLHIYKPLLLLALEEYFRSPVPETLASLYNAMNSMDLSLLPKLSFLERNVLQASSAPDMFVEKFEQMIAQRQVEDAAVAQQSLQEGPGSPIRVPPNRYTLPRDTHEFESRVLYNGIPVPIKIPTAISPETVGDFSLIKLIQTFSIPHTTAPQPFALHPHLTTSGAYTHPIIVLVNALLTQKRVVFLGHNRPAGEVAEAVLASCALASGGMLRGFTRHAFPYTDLTKIDDLIKVPGFIAGVTNPAFAHKPEWWDLLCDLPSGRMKISHKIEGPPVTDGLLYFQSQQSHIPTSTSSSLAAGLSAQLSMSMPGSKGSQDADPTGDTQFMDALLTAINERRGEAAIRSRWRDWVHKFTRIAATFEETVYGASALYIGASSATLSPTSPDTETPFDANIKGHGYVWATEAEKLKELAANVHRVEGWRNTRSYYSYVQDLARVWERQPVRHLDLMWLHDRLHRGTRLTHDQSAGIYLALARAVEDAGRRPPSELAPPSTTATGRAHGSSQKQYDTILQLLGVTPESNSGIFYLSLGLFHPRPDVRLAVCGLLEHVMENEAGRHFWAALGRFAKLAFYRIKREEPGASTPGLLGG